MQCSTGLKKGIFILSLDCEGKWGMADRISSYHETYFINANIKNAYAQILSVLKLYKIPASFAFVSAFTQSLEEFKKNKDVFFDVPSSYKPWLTKFHQDISQVNYEGWLCPEAFEMVADSNHEIGSHSCFHRPLSENDLSFEDAEYDFRSSKQLMSEKKPDLNTFIYPRNIVGFTSLLKKYGYMGYRHGLSYKTNHFGRLLNLASEFNILQKAEAPPQSYGGLQIVPAGFFLNWPHGLRKHVPNSVTNFRWRNIIMDAVKNRRVAHMWFHPHNFINHPAMHENFKRIMEKVSYYRDKDLLSVMTMREYCLQKLSIERVTN